ncbi:MAG: hypothetical protein IVW57_08325 [Ktedonobacterales bacterium]|nr:hypothetical protein [Ktedonobacterales bacterium]
MLHLEALRDAITERVRPVPALTPLRPSPSAESAGTSRAGTSAGSAAVGVPGEAVPLEARAPVAWRRVVTQAAAMWLATRIAYALFTYFAVLFQHSGPVTEFTPFVPHALLASWQRWDAEWYIRIAQRGYWNDQPTAFFPLYPLLIKATTFVIGQHWLLAAMLVSNLGALLALIGVGLLAAHEDSSEAAAYRAIRVAVAYPLAFFLVAPYTEGLFLGFAALSLYSARRGLWRGAALWAFLAGLTRPTSVVLVPALAWEFGRQQGWWMRVGQWLGRARQRAAWAALPQRLRVWAQPDLWRAGWYTMRIWWRDDAAWRQPSWWWQGRWRTAPRVRALIAAVGTIGAAPAAIALYMAFLGLRFGHPLLWLHVQRIFWRRDAMPIISSVGGAIGQVFDMPPWTYWQARELVDLAPVLIFGLLTLLSVRRMPFAFTLYMVGLLYLAISTPVLDSPDPDMLISAGRFLVVAAPIFVLLGRWTERRPWLDLLLVSGGFLVQAILAAFFFAYGWLI